MQKIRIIERDLSCDECGCPFDTGDTAYEIDPDSPPYCSRKCGKDAIDRAVDNAERTIQASYEP
jgi:hypothetical protein